jgi:hypothetical protein
VGLGCREVGSWEVVGGDGEGIEVGVGAMSMARNGGSLWVVAVGG